MICAVKRKKHLPMKAWLFTGLLFCMGLYIAGVFFTDIGSVRSLNGWLLYGRDALIGIMVNIAVTLVFPGKRKRLRSLFLLAALLEILMCLWLHFSPPLGRLPLLSMAAELAGNALSAFLILTIGRFTREKTSF